MGSYKGVRTAAAVLMLVFAGAQTLAAADCCCSPRPPRAGAPAEAPAKPPSGPSDCGCDGLEFRSDAPPASPAPVAVVDPPGPLESLPIGDLLPAPAESPLLDPGTPDRDVGPPLHLRLRVLLV